MTQFIRAFALACLAMAVASCGQAQNGSRQEGAAQTGSADPSAAHDAGCPAIGDLHFICGVKAPEDLVLVPNTRWLIASGMQPGSGLHLIDTQAKTAQTVAVSMRADETRYASCPGPLDPGKALLHGLSLRPRSAGGYTLYATNHGGRESIEVFELDAQSADPSIAWVGCVLMPGQLAANSVAAFTDGTLLATVVTLPGKSFEDIFAGRNTGVVLQWTPGSAGFQMLPGTELPANNGIETSLDDREFYVASSGLKRIVVYSRANPSKPLRFAQLAEFAPDNVRLMGTQLVTAGMIDAEPACGGAPKKAEDIQCPRGYIAVSVDPQTMAVKEIARGPAAPPYAGTAIAVQVGNDLWLSSFNTDRVAYRTLSR